MRYLAVIFSVIVLFVFTSCEKEKEEPKAENRAGSSGYAFGKSC